MQKWEYISIFWSGAKIYIGADVVADNEKAIPLTYMQQLGEQGWEMVTAVSESVSVCVGGSALEKEKRGGLRWYFKRPKP